jgi:cobalamin biosynthesis protein CobT
MKDVSAAKNHSTSPPLEDKGEEDEDEVENGDEDADADEDEDSDEEDKEVHGGAAGERGAGDGKSDEDVRIIGQQSAQHHKEDGKRATECVNDAAAAKKAKTSTLSTEQQSFVSKFNPAPAKIDKERKISTRNVKGRLNSLKKQGARLNDVKGATIAKRLQEFSGN